MMNNSRLMAWSRTWELDGDLIRCRYCNTALIASRDGEELRHRDGCVNASGTHPWHDLRQCLSVLGFDRVKLLCGERNALQESHAHAVDRIDELRQQVSSKAIERLADALRQRNDLTDCLTKLVDALAVIELYWDRGEEPVFLARAAVEGLAEEARQILVAHKGAKDEQ